MNLQWLEIRKLAFLLLAAIAASAQQPQPVTRKYVMVMGANHAGTQVMTIDGTSARSTSSSTIAGEDRRRTRSSRSTSTAFRDRDDDRKRLPESAGRRAASPRATASCHFVNKAEKGDGAGDAFYVGMYGPPEETGCSLGRCWRTAGT